MRRLLQPLWVLLALIFLLEAWLWDHLEPVVARVIAAIPLRAVKLWLTDKISRLSPPLTLAVFLVPVVLLFPLKILGVWLLAHHNWLGAALVIMFGKLLGVGVTAFVFDVTRPKLLQMGWFQKLYAWVLSIRRQALALVAPTMKRMRRMVALFRARSSSRWMRLAWRLRRRVQAAR